MHIILLNIIWLRVSIILEVCISWQIDQQLLTIEKKNQKFLLKKDTFIKTDLNVCMHLALFWILQLTLWETVAVHWQDGQKLTMEQI